MTLASVKSRRPHQKTTKSLHSQRSHKKPSKPQHSCQKAVKPRHSYRPLNYRDWCLLGCIIICAICISTSLCVDAAINPARDAQKSLEELADDFYIDYLYPTVLGNNIYNPSAEMPKYVDRGLPIQRLRQLLYYNDSATAKYYPSLANRYVTCDLNDTTVRYFPVEPYGPRDYTVTFQLSCKGPAANSQWIIDHSAPPKN